MSRSHGRVARVAVLTATVALVAGACGTSGGSDSGTSTGKKGGTLNLLMESDFEHLDPARSYVSTQLEMARLLYPTLTGYPNEAGEKGTELVPDASTDVGTPNADGTQWSFTIKDSLKWEDGKQVTCEDFKYGVERSFSDVLPDGPQYQKQYLKGGKSYKGIYLQPEGLDSVTCDGNKITYALDRSVGDFNYTVSLPLFAAVRKDKDTKEKYDSSVFSYGPYKIDSYTRDKSLTLSRNTHWDQGSDKIRKNLPDKMVFTMGISAADMTDRLVQDRGADQAAIMYGTNVSPEQSQEVTTNDAVKKRAVSGINGYTWYLAINNSKVTDINCRKAYTYAVNKETYRTAIGGAAYGDYASTIIAPTLQAHTDADPYGLKDKPTGDPAMAKTLLGQASSCSKNIKFDYAQTPVNDKVAAAIKDAYARAGITVTPNPIKRAEYYSTISKRAVQNEISLASWGADWPSGSTVIPPLFDGRQIVPEGNQNYAQLNDPAINSGMDAAAKITDADESQKAWGALDLKVQEDAATVPLRYAKSLILVGSKVSGAYLDANYGEVNLANVAVQ